MAAALAVLAAVAVLVVVFFGRGDSYELRAVFQNAGQLVKGNQVEVSGQPVGTIEDIRLTGDAHAEIVMSLDKFTPVHAGTTAVVRSTSLAGIANRYVALSLGPNSGPALGSGATIAADRTTAPVDLDQLFDTLDPRTRRSLQRVIHGSATQYGGRAREARASLRLFNPALSTSSSLLRELVRDRVVFGRFVADSANVVSDLAQRRTQLADLVGNASATTSAVASENHALARTLDILPSTLRNANTTFVNLRSTLDDLDPLVNESKPATRRLAPFLAVLRPLVRDARPTIRDLRTLMRAPGPGNDLIELARKAPRLANLTDVVFPSSVRALRKTQPIVEYTRPYAPDLAGWLTKFGQGASPYDANGHYARIQPMFNAFQFVDTPGGGQLDYSGATGRLAGLQTYRAQRCPGGAVQPSPDGSAPWKPSPGFSCDLSTTLPGP